MGIVAFKRKAILIGAVLILMGLMRPSSAMAAPVNFSICGELKSVELTSPLYSWGVAQIFNEFFEDTPLALVNDYEAVSALIKYLPPEEVRNEAFRSLQIWNSAIGGDGTYILCVYAHSISSVSRAGRVMPSYSDIQRMNLFYKGELLLSYSDQQVEIVQAVSDHKLSKTTVKY